jgi:hypothetical protein
MGIAKNKISTKRLMVKNNVASATEQHAMNAYGGHGGNIF